MPEISWTEIEASAAWKACSKGTRRLLKRVLRPATQTFDITEADWNYAGLRTDKSRTNALIEALDLGFIDIVPDKHKRFDAF